MEAASSSFKIPQAFCSETKANLNIQILANGLSTHNWGCGEITYIVNNSSKQFSIMLNFMGQLDTELTRYEGTLCYQNSITPVTSALAKKEAKKSKATKAQAAVPKEIKQWKFNFELDAGELGKQNLTECLIKLEKKLNKDNWDSLLSHILNPEQRPSADHVIAILRDGFNLTLPISSALTDPIANSKKYLVNHEYPGGISYTRSYLESLFNTASVRHKCERHTPPDSERMEYFSIFSSKKVLPPINCRNHPNYDGVCDQNLWNFTGYVVEFYLKCVPEETKIIKFIIDNLPTAFQFKTLNFLIKEIEINHQEIFEYLLKGTVLTNQVTEHEQESREVDSLLLSAIKFGHFEYALFILKNTKVDLKFTNEQGDTALHIMMAFQTDCDKNSTSMKHAANCLDELLSKIPHFAWAFTVAFLFRKFNKIITKIIPNHHTLNQILGMPNDFFVEAYTIPTLTLHNVVNATHITSKQG